MLSTPQQASGEAYQGGEFSIVRVEGGVVGAELGGQHDFEDFVNRELQERSPHGAVEGGGGAKLF